MGEQTSRDVVTALPVMLILGGMINKQPGNFVICGTSHTYFNTNSPVTDNRVVIAASPCRPGSYS